MRSIVVYQSRHGNTQKVAQAIAAGLKRGSTVEVYSTAGAPVAIPEELELFVVGGPTEGHAMSQPMAEYLARLGGMSAQSVATFDTRLRWPRFVSGSAAVDISRKLLSEGANRIAEPMSFFVSGKDPRLEPGELERAEAWGASLAEIAVKAKAELAR